MGAALCYICSLVSWTGAWYVHYCESQDASYLIGQAILLLMLALYIDLKELIIKLIRNL